MLCVGKIKNGWWLIFVRNGKILSEKILRYVKALVVVLPAASAAVVLLVVVVLVVVVVFPAAAAVVIIIMELIKLI